MNGRAMVCGVVLLVGCGSGAGSPGDSEPTVGKAASALSRAGFDVDFVGCEEFAGIGQIPAANARAAVPATYALAGSESDAIIVVRVASCASSVVDGRTLGRTITAQVGVSLLGQDTTASINNYTWYYATNQARLHARLRAAGLDAELTRELSIDLSAGHLRIETPLFRLESTAVVPGPDPVEFIASWWENGHHGAVRSRTVFPAIRFGTAVTKLTTSPRSKLAALIGSPSLTFALLDSYNLFPDAHLEVRDAD